MKFLHCADIHLDSPMVTNLDPKKASIRREEIKLSFSKMIQYADKNDIHIILIAGDLFDSNRISKSCREYIINLIEEYSNIDFLYLVGNHEQDNIFQNLELKNLKLFDDDWKAYKYENVVFTGSNNTSNANELATKLFLNKDDINIVCLHGQESTSTSNDPNNINLKLFKNKYIDYLALGHVHSFKLEKLDRRGSYCYCGCLEGRGFDECGQKGFVVCEINQSKIFPTFINFSQRQFHEINVDITGLTTSLEIEKEIKKQLEDIHKEDSLKIVLTGTYPDSSIIQINYLETLFNKEYFFVKIVNKTSIYININDYEYDISLRGEFIRTVKREKLSSEEENDILNLGIKALKGDEI